MTLPMSLEERVEALEEELRNRRRASVLTHISKLRDLTYQIRAISAGAKGRPKRPDIQEAAFVMQRHLEALTKEIQA